MLITSLTNPKIKKYLKLKVKKYRDLEKMFLIEGSHLIEDYDFNYTYVSENIMKKLSETLSIPKVIGVLKYFPDKEIKGDRVLLLDDIGDPGNLGTIIRSSVAFNVHDIVLNLNSVDIYNPKVIRSTQGMLFKVNIKRLDLKDVIKDLKNKGYLILGTNVLEGIDVKDVKANKFALIMGNEGQGVKKELLDLCDKNLYINMNKECESLNVGVATSILLYELNR